jgi:Phage tail assembly chaperone proteins, E, or 41 or 14
VRDEAQGEVFTWPLTHKLTKRVTAHGEEVEALELREPTAGDLLKRGILDDALTAQQIADLISDLAAVPPSAIKAMAAGDFMRLQRVLIRFLSQAAG